MMFTVMQLFGILFFSFAIPLLIWGIIGAIKDIIYYMTYDK